MPQLRVSPSGPVIVGENDDDVLLWDAATKEWEPGPVPGGGGTPLPIQQVRFLDPTSAVTPNGSIVGPWIDAADFFADVAGDGGWELRLPGFDAGDFVIPDLSGVPIALVGVSAEASDIGSIPIAAQGQSEPFDPLTMSLRTLHARHLTFNGGPLELTAESCTLDQVEATGTVTGHVRFINCHLGGTVNFPDATLDCQSCVIGQDSGSPATFVLFGGTLRDCKFLNQVTLQLFGALALYDCAFGTGFKIQCSASQTITCDPSTYAALVDAEPTFLDTAPTLAQKPIVLYQAQIGLVNGFVIPASTITIGDLGVMTDPPALPGGQAQVQFHGDGGSTTVCVGATIDGSGHVLVRVLNTSSVATAAVLNDQPFDVFYQPAELW